MVFGTKLCSNSFLQLFGQFVPNRGFPYFASSARSPALLEKQKTREAPWSTDTHHPRTPLAVAQGLSKVTDELVGALFDDVGGTNVLISS